MAVDISTVTLIAPVLAYLIVAFIVGALLWKFQILGESKAVAVFVALIIAALFVSFAGAKDLVLTIIPWFAVLVIALFLVLFIIGFVGKNAEFMTKPIGIIFIVLLGIVFIVSAFVVFNDTIVSYIPGPGYGDGASENALFFTDWLFSSRVLGAIALLIASAVVAWVLVKAK